MAWSTHVEGVEYSAAAAGTVLTFSPAATIPAGTLLALSWAVNITGVTPTVSDNSSQVGPANTYYIDTVRVGTTLNGGIIWCLTTRAILATDVITITVASATRRNGRMLTWAVPGGGSPIIDKATAAANVTASPLSFASTGTLLQTGELGIASGFYTSNGLATATCPTSGWSSIVGPVSGSGGPTTFVEVDVCYNLNAGTAAEAPTHAYTRAPTSAVGSLLTFMLPSVRPKQTITRRTRAGN